MKTLTPALAAALAGGVGTFATCWRLTRADGRVFGFTDHDRDLVFAGVVHAAATGFTATETTARADLSVGGLEVEGALTSDVLTVDDVEAGLWDGAAIEIDLVDWSDPNRRLTLRRGVLGEISRADGAFTAEVRSLAHALDETRGRLFQHRCDAELGDARCGVVVATTEVVVAAIVDDHRLRITGLESATAGDFDRGLARVTDGEGAGRSSEIRFHGVEIDGVVLDLWRPLGAGLAVGDRLALTPGCDRRFETCRDRFGNAVAFRGFPFIPGNDFLIASPAVGGAVNDGGAYVS
ncbi:MAG: DUF2163 domain-containing protein [Phyllobacteriaceae bacterium]|nr:DUF2163 domain-containing protein [Phyllobacteriaceae bacterium]